MVSLFLLAAPIFSDSERYSDINRLKRLLEAGILP